MINNIFEISNVRLYIDPATTSYVIQIVAGIIIACGAAIGVFWNKITRLFRKNKEKSNPEMSVKSNGEETGQVIKAKDLLSDDEGKND